MPEDAKPIQRSCLVASLSVGIEVIRLRRLSRDGRIGSHLPDVLANLAAGNLPELREALTMADREIASIPDARPGAPVRLTARSALLAIGEAVNRQREYFENHPS
jgi:hypothetical protein